MHRLPMYITTRYILSGNISRMGSDNYADGSFRNIPRRSVGWVLSEESWLKNSFVNLLKLRASLRTGRTSC